MTKRKKRTTKTKGTTRRGMTKKGWNAKRQQTEDLKDLEMKEKKGWPYRKKLELTRD